MISPPVRRVLLMGVAIACLAACGSREPPSLSGFLQYVSDLDAIGLAISRSLEYPQGRVKVSGNRTYLHVSVFDPKLVEADPATLDRVARAVVAAAEPVIAAHTEFSTIQVITVGIHHPSGFSPPIREWHSENVIEFRRGSDQRFTVYVD